MTLLSNTPNNKPAIQGVHDISASIVANPSKTKHVFFRPSLLYLAIAISVVAHMLAYWVTPHFISVWNEPTPSRFDAVIVAGISESTPPPVSQASTRESVPPPPASVSRPRKPSSKTAARPPKPLDNLLMSQPDEQSVQRKNPNEIDALEFPDLAAAQSAAIAAATIEPIPDPIQAAAIYPLSANKPVPQANDAAREKSIERANVKEASGDTPLPQSLPSSRLGSSRTDVVGPDFPGSINIDYKMTSSVANGVANLAWKRNGDEYEINTSIQATGFFTSMFVGVFRQTSRGEVTSDGVRPNFFSLTRGDAAADTAEFKRATNELKIIKHGETHLLPLPERMQDMQSFLFQMAHDVALLKAGQDVIEVQATNARKVYKYKFRRTGEETVQTQLGPLAAIHLKSEAADPEDVYEIWLAPQYFYMPVKLKFYMGRFPIEQVASSVRVSEPQQNALETGVRK